MKKVYSILTAAVLLTATIITGCENEKPISNTEEVKVNIRIVGIDSTSGARTEDKVLFVNVK
jgi:predicted component of type VI protein secretion system